MKCWIDELPTTYLFDRLYFITDDEVKTNLKRSFQES